MPPVDPLASDPALHPGPLASPLPGDPVPGDPVPGDPVPGPLAAALAGR